MSNNINAALMSSLQATNAQIQTHQNNVANSNTIAFKKAIAHTTSSEYTDYNHFSTNSFHNNKRPNRIQIGSGSQVQNSLMNLTNGGFKSTEDPLNIAIVTSGFFKLVDKNNKKTFTRAGIFRIDADTKRIVSANSGKALDGIRALPSGTDTNDIQINRDGTVIIKTTQESLGKIETFTFEDVQGLEKLGNSEYGITEASGSEIKAPETALKQGFLEESNVDVTEEIFALSELQALQSQIYELLRMNSKLADKATEMLHSK